VLPMLVVSCLAMISRPGSHWEPPLACPSSELSFQFKTYLEIDVQIATATKLLVAHLERDRHLVFLVKLFVEAFARMRFHLDVVRIAEDEEGGDDQEESIDQRHDGRGR